VARAPRATGRTTVEPGGASFVAQCAPCHGENGDGKGTTQLDRQARSFKDGGFSYGNTLPALYRSITTGIPGTPMPGFEFALAEDERRALAEYVLSLGPEDAIADTPEKVLVVGERTLVVRGLLPPIVEGASERTRGLLIGTPAGTTFEYRADDVRLLGVRQGDFVERRDWVGRGATHYARSASPYTSSATAIRARRSCSSCHVKEDGRKILRAARSAPTAMPSAPPRPAIA
jgi:mono/diheme cytochrome c family protein